MESASPDRFNQKDILPLDGQSGVLHMFSELITSRTTNCRFQATARCVLRPVSARELNRYAFGLGSDDARAEGEQDLLEPSRTSERAVFARIGEYWSISFRASTFALRDTTGLGYIQRLLQNPGVEFHSIDLFSGLGEPAEADRAGLGRADSLSVRRLGDAGEMLDAQAKNEYRQRLRELRQDLQEQRDRGDVERATRTESEIEFLTREITRAVGLGGRDRRAGSAAERARLNVSRAIRTSIAKISEQKRELADLLTQTIRTGNFCSYVPEPGQPLDWEFYLLESSPNSETSQSGPLLAIRQTTFVKPEGDRTSFVGRERERSLLRLYLGRALRGERKMIALSGAAGAGKTRLANEVRAEASRNGFITLGGNCYENEGAAPLGPFVQMLDAAIARSSDRDFVRNALGEDADQIVLLLPHLRRTHLDLSAQEATEIEQSRPMLFNAFISVLFRLVARKPLFLFLDDLQWADEATISLLAHLLRSQISTPLLVLVTYRDHEWSFEGPLAAVLDEFARTQLLDTIALEGLPQGSVKEMISALSGKEPPVEVVSFIHSGTEGNPFFIEELYRHLAEHGKLFESNGEFRRQFASEDLTLPKNLKTVIGRRLGRIAQATREVLEVAAVIGRSFTFRALEAATALDADALIERLEDSERLGLLLSTIEYPEALFHFSHELIRQALLEGVSSARLQRLHVAVANAIESVYKNDLDERLNDIAHHLWRAGVCVDPLRTSTALASAAHRALAQSAYDMAVDYSKKALKSLERHTEGSDRNGIELSAQVVLGNALMATNGYAASEVERAFARARLLSQSISQSSHLLPIVFGLFMFYLMRGRYDTAQELGKQLLDLAENEQNCEFLFDAHVLLGGVSFYRGDISPAREHLENAMELLNSDSERPCGSAFAQDRVVLALSWMALTLWMFGYPDQAVVYSEKALRSSVDQAHAFSRAVALTFDAVLHQQRGEPEIVGERARESLAISTEHGFPLFAACDTLLLGWSRKEQGQLADGLLQLQDGLRQFRASHGTNQTLPYYLTLLAEAQCEAGQFEEGFKSIVEAESVMLGTGERMAEAEIYRVRGLLAGRRGRLHHAEAEQFLLKSIGAAREQKSKGFELRAAISLAELWVGQGRKSEARELLSDLYLWFTEGLQTPHMRRAANLLSVCGKEG
jgi:predicted ATPase